MILTQWSVTTSKEGFMGSFCIMCRVQEAEYKRHNAQHCFWCAKFKSRCIMAALFVESSVVNHYYYNTFIDLQIDATTYLTTCSFPACTKARKSSHSLNSTKIKYLAVSLWWHHSTIPLLVWSLSDDERGDESDISSIFHFIFSLCK